MGDEGLGVVEFQSEGFPEERGQPALDLPGFGLRPGKSQYVIVRLCGLPDYADGAPGTWVCTGDCGGVVAIILGLSR
jgi:hypothetical protein